MQIIYTHNITKLLCSMNLSQLFISAIVAVILIGTTEWIKDIDFSEPNCKQIEYKQRARPQLLVVCKDTLVDTGTGHQHETLKDSIKTIRGQL